MEPDSDEFFSVYRDDFQRIVCRCVRCQERFVGNRENAVADRILDEHVASHEREVAAVEEGQRLKLNFGWLVVLATIGLIAVVLAAIVGIYWLSVHVKIV